MKIDLNIFTNCTASAPKTDIIKQTYESFCDTFGRIEPVVWCDPKPNTVMNTKYRHNLFKTFKTVEQCKSMSDGYIKAIHNSDADWIFMLEHDWIFVQDNIKHSLNEIIKYMEFAGLYHLRFNKRKNIVKLWDKSLKEKNILSTESKNSFKYCITPCLSNNPHIINRKKYLEFIKKGYIKVLPGSKGIEDQITKRPELNGAIYGGLNYPATVYHTDGRKIK